MSIENTKLLEILTSFIVGWVIGVAPFIIGMIKDIGSRK